MKIDFDSLIQNIGAVGEALTALHADRERARAERDAIAALPVERETLIAELEALIDHQGDEYRTTLHDIATKISQRADRSISAMASTTAMLLTKDGKIDPYNLLLGLLGNEIKAALRDAIAAMPLPDADGLTREERAARLAELDCRIAAIDAEIADVRARLAQAGIGRDPVMPTLEQIRDHFKGGIPTGTNYEKGLKDLFRQLNPDLGP